MPRSTDTTSTKLCAAIRERRLLEFDYNGLKRIVVPYCYGVSMRDAEVLRGVQIRGQSSKGGFGFGKLGQWLRSRTCASPTKASFPTIRTTTRTIAR